MKVYLAIECDIVLSAMLDVIKAAKWAGENR